MTVHYREMHRLQVFSHARTMETHHGRCAAWTVRRYVFVLSFLGFGSWTHFAILAAAWKFVKIFTSFVFVVLVIVSA